MLEIQKILKEGTLIERKALFLFQEGDSNEKVIFRFNLWARYFFPQYFENEDAPFHDEMNSSNLDIYRGKLDSFVNIAFRGAGKDVKTKLFIPYVILNDPKHYRRYFKVLSADVTNAKQTVTDIYNMLISPRVVEMYPDTFEKTIFKREETMGAFTTATGIKVLADSVGTEQRGAIQEEARPDFIWFNDFETRKTLRSIVITKSIHDNMEEARTSLQKGGGCVYTCNYISEMGNVHRLVTEKQSDRKKVMILSILNSEGQPVWDRYTLKDIQKMREDDDDFEGERMCKPNASKDIYFDREILDKMESRLPIRDIAGFKMYRTYNPSHRYAGGHDIAGGVGLDSSASVFIDFSTIPAQVVGTFASNTILPEAFGDEIYAEANYFGGCLVAPENNKFDQTILKAKQLGANLYKVKKGQTLQTIVNTTQNYTYGWNTNSLTKSKMMADLRKAVNDGFLVLNDKDLIQEAKSYTRNDLIDTQPDPRDVQNATRHFDLLTACAISFAMKDHAEAVMVEAPMYYETDAVKLNPAE
jgi:hypothetical protein